MGGKTDIYNRPGLCAPYFCWINRYQGQVHIAFYIMGEKTGTCNWPGFKYMPDIIFWVRKKMPVTRKIYSWLHILGGKIGISYEYILRFIYWVGKQYLQPVRPQVLTQLHILGGKTGTYNQSSFCGKIFLLVYFVFHISSKKIGICNGPGRIYIFGFVYRVGK